MALRAFFSVLRSIMPNAVSLSAFRFTRSLVPLVMLFVQRVTGLPPGLYALIRAQGAHKSLLDWVRERAPQGPRPYRWTRVEDAPDDLPLYCLDQADVSDFADACTLGQGRMRGGAVVFMAFAEYEPALRLHGPWIYRRLLWEAGAIGQALYFAAEEVGVQGTGHGAYFGGLAHELLGVDARDLQDVYHFIIGTAIPDLRMKLEPYEHLEYYRSLRDRDAVDTTFAYAVGGAGRAFGNLQRDEGAAGDGVSLRVRGR